MKTRFTLPASWQVAALSEIAIVIQGQSPPGSTYNVNGEGLPFFQGKAEFTELSPVVSKWCSEPNKIAEPGDVLISVRAPVGPTNVANVRCCIGRGLAAIRTLHGIPTKFLLYYLRYSESDLAGKGTGTTFTAISGNDLRQHPVVVPPLSEQVRLVEAIETQFTRLDAAMAALERVRANLKRYRVSVLKAAVEGRLVPTEAELARKEGRDFEPASRLLDRILAERRRRWEESELARMKAAGKSPKDDRWKSKYKEPVAPDTSTLSQLPEGWCWANVGQLTWSVKDGPHYSPEYSEDGIPFITGGNVRPSGVDFESAKHISRELHESLSRRCKPEFGDILYTKGGTTGIARVNTYRNEFNVWVHVAVLKLCSSVEPFYLQHALNSPLCFAQAQQFTHGVGNQDLGLTRMIRIAVPLPPRSEQLRLISETDRLMSLIDELEPIIGANAQRLGRLRQSILKWAFEGKLVEQDPDDEPASALLERIRAEGAAATPSRKSRKPMTHETEAAK